MPGCDVKFVGPGDADAAVGRVLGWVFGSAGLGAIVFFLNAASIGGPVGWALLAIFVGALAFAVAGFWVGWAVNWFDRLFPQDPSTATISGCVLCAGKNRGFPPFNDNDWTFNLGGPSFAVEMPLGLSLSELRERDAPGNGPAFAVNDADSGQQALHCEIGSHIGDYAAVGGAIGGVAGLLAGIGVGIAICVALGIGTFGIGTLICLLVIALAMLVGAIVGGLAGDAIGAGIGAIADEVDDFDERGEAISKGCLMRFTGRWITDSSHQHNEIHDIESAQIIECNNCLDATGSASSGLIAAVGIGRHPTGIDP
jgi:small-conductance mechanosensitive channel